jgi:pimeloyl-ACP methyl ester carboxylesterase/tRNA A-37 threonylcarbamoyl transferase component Bud32
MTLQQEIRFCTTRDGVRIAYSTMGEGPPLVRAAHWLSHLEYDLRTPVWQGWLREMSRYHTYVRYDERGCGLSDWEVEDFSFDAWVDDLEAVVDALGLERFALLGLSQGGPVAISYAVRHPERVSHLVLYGTYACGWAKRGEPPESVAERQALVTLTRQGWGRDNPAYRQVFSSQFIPEASPEQLHWFNELQRVSSSPENAARFQLEFGNIDVQELVPRVQAPTLVMHLRGDLRIPFDEGRRLAARIPDARFVPLDGQNHILLDHEPAWSTFMTELRTFLGVGSEEPVPVDESGAPSVAPARGTPLPSRGATGTSGDPHELLNAAVSHAYELEEELAGGGMATVYLARDRRHDRRVAIKLIDPELISAEGRKRFEREIQITSKLQHPHIVPLIDSGTAGDLLYYITPFVPGASLADRLRSQGRVPLEEALRITRDVGEALDYAHRNGVVHRDIKPGNILISDGQAIVTDFGIARAVRGDAETALTSTGIVMGTLLYISPEQLRAGSEIDGRTDIYSLGCVLYEMLIGRPPFEGTTEQVIRAHALERPVPPGERAPGLPGAVNTAVMRALEKDPSKRFASAAEFAEALEASRVASAGGVGWLRSPWFASAVTAAVVLAVAVVLARACGA